MEQTLKVSLFGVTGYTAVELLRVLARHPHVEITSLISSSRAGERLEDVYPFFRETPLGKKTLLAEPGEEFELAFLCLPHEASLEIVPSLISKGYRVIDLSGAYRIGEAGAYLEFYGFEHTHAGLLSEATYGLPEIFRKEIKDARLVANPGCYPTAALLALYPILKEVEVESVTVHAISGISGAGRKTRQRFHYPEMEENAFVYSVEKHRHTPEIEHVLKKLTTKEIRVRFTPTVVPMSRGMLSTAYVRCGEVNLKELYRETYAGEPFVKVVDEPPMTAWVLGTNLCFIYTFYDKRTETAVIVSAIDNLGKGASLQAIQNMNLMAGFEEETSLPTLPLFP